MSILVLKQIFEAKWFFSCRFENFKICKIGIAYLKKTCIIKQKTRINKYKQAKIRAAKKNYVHGRKTKGYCKEGQRGWKN